MPVPPDRQNKGAPVQRIDSNSQASAANNLAQINQMNGRRPKLSRGRAYTQKKRSEGRLFLGIHLTPELLEALDKRSEHAGKGAPRRGHLVENLISPLLSQPKLIERLLPRSLDWHPGMPIRRISAARRKGATFDISATLHMQLTQMKADHSMSAAVETLCRYALEIDPIELKGGLEAKSMPAQGGLF